MVTTLLKDSNILIRTSVQDLLTIRLNWIAPDDYELDASAFMLTSSGNVPDDEAMIFFNQPKSVDNALHYSDFYGNFCDGILWGCLGIIKKIFQQGVIKYDKVSRKYNNIIG